jgi:hypothetical protein
MSEKLSEVLLIAKDQSGEERVINLIGLAIELIVPAPKASGCTADFERRLAEAREGLEFYADAKNYDRGGRNQSKAQEDRGDIARDTLEAIADSNGE